MPSRPSADRRPALRYLSGYTHRVAISNRRLVVLKQGNVTFRWRDSAHANKQRLLTLPVDEFLRGFLLHLLPRGFMRIRTSASSPTGDALRCCRSASSCSRVQPALLLEPHRLMRITLAHPSTGTVPFVAAPCTSWNGSLRLNSGPVLHPSPHLCAARACNSSLDLSTCLGMPTVPTSHRACATNKITSSTIRSCFKTTYFCIVHGRDPPTPSTTLVLRSGPLVAIR
jgi:hypothetical protein